MFAWSVASQISCQLGCVIIASAESRNLESDSWTGNSDAKLKSSELDSISILLLSLVSLLSYYQTAQLLDFYATPRLLDSQCLVAFLGLIHLNLIEICQMARAEFAGSADSNPWSRLSR